MAKGKSPSNSHNSSTNNSSSNLTPTYSNASVNSTTGSGIQPHLPQHIYYNPDLRREPSSASLTPPTTISMPIPPLPPRQHSIPQSTTTTPATNQHGNNVYRDALANSQREREQQKDGRDRDFRSFSPYSNQSAPDYHDNPLTSSISSSSTASYQSSTNPYILSSSNTSSNGSNNNSAVTQASAAALERGVMHHPQTPSRSSSSSSHSSQQSYQPSHSVQASTTSQISPVSSIRSIIQPEKKAKSLISRSSINSIQSTSSARSSMYDDTGSASSSSSKKAVNISIERPKDDAEIERMFISLMVS